MRSSATTDPDETTGSGGLAAGSELGAIQVFDKQDGDFAGDDEAALLHLAQMTSAAVERARSYQARTSMAE